MQCKPIEACEQNISWEITAITIAVYIFTDRERTGAVINVGPSGPRFETMIRKRDKNINLQTLVWAGLNLNFKLRSHRVNGRETDKKHHMFNSNFRQKDNETSELEKVSDDNLSVIFNNEKTRDYIASRGIMLLHWTPLKPLVENISTIRGIEGSTNIYSDIKPGPDGCTGLLTCCTKYKAARKAQMDFKFCLDI